jgi:hypothetical protein
MMGHIGDADFAGMARASKGYREWRGLDQFI